MKIDYEDRFIENCLHSLTKFAHFIIKSYFCYEKTTVMTIVLNNDDVTLPIIFLARAVSI